MSWIDYLIFAAYMAGVLAIGWYHYRRNRNSEDYYVGSRSIKAHHVGLSIVATDVGGGFSIGLGGVGFVMGLAGTWLLMMPFTAREGSGLPFLDALFTAGGATNNWWWLVPGVALHGICYTFYFITGQIFIDRELMTAPTGKLYRHPVSGGTHTVKVVRVVGDTPQTGEVSLAVDGQNMEAIEEILGTEIEKIRQRHQLGGQATTEHGVNG